MYETEGKPDYKGSRDEIIRGSIERAFERQITMRDCDCGYQPKKMFRSCHDYFVQCSACGKRTKMYRHVYESMQAWNRKEYVSDDI